MPSAFIHTRSLQNLSLIQLKHCLSLGTQNPYVAPTCKSQYRSTSKKSSAPTYQQRLLALFEVNHGSRPPTTASHYWPPQPLIQSWRQKVVEAHLSLLDELIKFPEGNCSHHLLGNNHVAGSPPPGRYPTAAFNSIHPRT